MDQLTCDSALVDWTLPEAAAVLQAMGLTITSNDGTQIRCSCPWGLLGTEYHSHGNLQNPAYIVTIEEDHSGHKYMRGWCNACTETRTASDKTGLLYHEKKDVKSDDIEALLFILRHSALTTYADDPASLGVYQACGEALQLCIEHHLNGGFSHYDKPVAKAPTKKGSAGVFHHYPDGFLNTKRFPSAFTSEIAMNYLHSRGVPDWVVTDLDIRYDDYLRMVCFPYFAKAGVLAGVRGRSVYDDQAVRLAYAKSKGFTKDMKHYCYTFKDNEGTRYSNTATTWYLQSQLSKKTYPVILCEGAFDAARIFAHYDNVTAIFTQTPSDKKLSFFSKMGKGGGIIFLGDNDLGEDGKPTKQSILTRTTVRDYFQSRNIPFMDAYLPADIKDPASFPHGIDAEDEEFYEDNPEYKLGCLDTELRSFINEILDQYEETFPYPASLEAAKLDEDGEAIQAQEDEDSCLETLAHNL